MTVPSESIPVATEARPVLVVDFGAQYAQLIARRVREASVYSEIVPHSISAAEVAAKNPVGIILSGGPSSVYEPGAPALDPGIIELGVPVLGICYGFQVMAQQLGGEVGKTGAREYGSTDVVASDTSNVLLHDQPEQQITWMSHGDSVLQAPAGFDVLASSASTPVAAFANDARRLYGVQWHPEVKHTQYGQSVLENFLHRAAGIPDDWNSGNVIAEQVERIRSQVGSARVICGSERGSGLRRRGRDRAEGGRRSAHLHLRRPRPAASGRGPAGAGGLRGRPPASAWSPSTPRISSSTPSPE